MKDFSNAAFSPEVVEAMQQAPVKVGLAQEGNQRFLLKEYADGSDERTPILKLGRSLLRYRYRTVILDKSGSLGNRC
jgi:hypothetical protein